MQQEQDLPVSNSTLSENDKIEYDEGNNEGEFAHVQDQVNQQFMRTINATTMKHTFGLQTG